MPELMKSADAKEPKIALTPSPVTSGEMYKIPSRTYDEPSMFIPEQHVQKMQGTAPLRVAPQAADDDSPMDMMEQMIIPPTVEMPKKALPKQTEKP